MEPLLRVFVNALLLMRRAKYIQASVAIVCVVALVAQLSAYFGGRQPATVALDVGLSTLRILLPLLMVFQVQDLFSREFDKRFYLSALSYPGLRWTFLIGRFSAILLWLLLVLILTAFVLIFVVNLAAQGYPQATPVDFGSGYFLVFGFVAVDISVLTAVAVLIAVLASTSSMVMVGTFGFMMIARSYSSIIELLARDAGLVVAAEQYRSGLGALSYVLPDLGALDIRGVALYGRFEFLPLDWGWLLLSSSCYVIGVVGVSVLAFQYKRFS